MVPAGVTHPGYPRGARHTVALKWLGVLGFISLWLHGGVQVAPAHCQGPHCPWSWVTWPLWVSVWGSDLMQVSPGDSARGAVEMASCGLSLPQRGVVLMGWSSGKPQEEKGSPYSCFQGGSRLLLYPLARQVQATASITFLIFCLFPEST